MTTRRGFVGAMLALLAPATMKASPLSSQTSLELPESLEETRRLMCLEIHTDSTVELDTAIFVDGWRRELGRIVNLNTASPFARGAGVVERERPPPRA